MTPAQIVGMDVRLYHSTVALGQHAPWKVIGETGTMRDKPGFGIDLIKRGRAVEAMRQHDRPSIFMPMRGHRRVIREGGATVVAPGGSLSGPENTMGKAAPPMTGKAALIHIFATGDPAGPTWQG